MATAPTHAPGTDRISEHMGREADLRYCPVCGYIDPKTRHTHCPRQHPEGMDRPVFQRAVYGYFIRVGLEEGKWGGS